GTVRIAVEQIVEQVQADRDCAKLSRKRATAFTHRCRGGRGTLVMRPGRSLHRKQASKEARILTRRVRRATEVTAKALMRFVRCRNRGPREAPKMLAALVPCVLEFLTCLLSCGRFELAPGRPVDRRSGTEMAETHSAGAGEVHGWRSNAGHDER